MKTFKKICNLNISQRFRGFLPVVVDIETTGVDPNKNALLEMSIVLIVAFGIWWCLRKASRIWYSWKASRAIAGLPAGVRSETTNVDGD